jgi:hypothetical protein
MTTRMNAIYIPSDDIVAREIEGEIIIIPLVAGIGDIGDELFTLNETGKAVWMQLDGKNTLESAVKNLELEFESDPEQIKKDVVGLVTELVKRRILVEVTSI